MLNTNIGNLDIKRAEQHRKEKYKNNMDKFDILNLEVDWRTPTLKQVYPRTDILMVMDNGRVRNFNTDFGGVDYYDNLDRFKEYTGLDGEEFNMMYTHDHKVSQLIKDNYEGVQIVYIGQM